MGRRADWPKPQPGNWSLTGTVPAARTFKPHDPRSAELVRSAPPCAEHPLPHTRRGVAGGLPIGVPGTARVRIHTQRSERHVMERHSPEKPDVSLRVPADGAYVSVLRTMTAGLAARLDFTVDDIEDLRIAIGEACALVLPQAQEGGDLEAEFRQTPGTLTVSVRVATSRRAEPDYESFAWQVLSTL